LRLNTTSGGSLKRPHKLQRVGGCGQPVSAAIHSIFPLDRGRTPYLVGINLS
jgi:hypothetical protein